MAFSHRLVAWFIVRSPLSPELRLLESVLFPVRIALSHPSIQNTRASSSGLVFSFPASLYAVSRKRAATGRLPPSLVEMCKPQPPG